jgi:aspartate aminotransferase
MSNDTLRLADRMQHIAMSPTMKGTMEAERLRREGVDVVDLGAGEPDFPTPAHITAAAEQAIERQFTKYTANMGILPLREAVGSRYQQDYGVTYRPDEVVITAGGKQALHHAALALFGPGDEVITHMPGWPTLVEQIKLADAKPVIVPRARREWICADRGDVPGGGDAENEGDHPQLTGQSDRRAAVRGGGAHSCGRGGPPRPLDRD